MSKEIEAQQELIKIPVYGIGEADPLYFQTITGLDIKVFFILKDETEVQMPTIQKFSCHAYTEGEWSVRGTIESILFDQDKVEQYRDKIKDIKLVANTEHNLVGTSYITGVEFMETGWSTSVEDIVTNCYTNFVAKGHTPWTRANE